MKSTIVGIDMGGTQIRAAQILDGKPERTIAGSVSATEAAEVILEELFTITDQVMDSTVKAIGIGVPSVVDVEKGIVYDVQNIPSWKEVHLKKYMEARYKVPVMVNNDANCFALGEKYFGQGKAYETFVGLNLGTGLGAGILIDGRLYAGPNCGAGEFGMVAYKEHFYEYYTSGQFFKNCHNTSGQTVYTKARKGDPEALAIWEEFGLHLGNAIQMILYCYDTDCIILGGSISKAYRFFKDSMWAQVRRFAYPRSLEHLRVPISKLAHSGVLGAAALYYNEMFTKIRTSPAR